MSAAFDPASRLGVSYSRMDVERKRDAIDAQSAVAFLFLPTYSGEFPHAGPLPVFGPLHQSPAHRVEMNVLHLFVIFPHRAQRPVEKPFLPKPSRLAPPDIDARRRTLFDGLKQVRS